MIYLVPIIFYIIGLFVNLFYVKLEGLNFYIDSKQKEKAFAVMKSVYPTKSDYECQSEYDQLINKPKG